MIRCMLTRGKVRAHGMVLLRRMVLDRDAVAIRNISKAISVFESQLHEPDSYGYLNAVSGLAAIADVCPRETIPVLCHKYCDRGLSMDIRLKLSETLARITTRCGQLLPEYGATCPARQFVSSLYVSLI